MLSNGLKLDISFLMLLILFSSVSMSLLKSNHASAISVGGILGVAKEAMDIVPALVSAAQSLGIAPKADTTTSPSPSPPPPSSSDAGDLKQEINQLRQEYQMKLNTISAQLTALNEKDRQIAKEQLSQTYNETLNHYSIPEQSFILNTTAQLAPQDLQYLNQVSKAFEMFKNFGCPIGPNCGHRPVINNMKV